MRTIDPLKLPRWALAQALAWMIDKTQERVSWADGKEVFDVANEAIRRDGADDATRSGALRRREELLERLSDGTLTAYGIGQGQSEHNPIPELAWHTIDCFYNYDGQCDAGPDDVYRSGESLPRYRKVFVRTEAVLRLWPLPEAESSAGARSEVQSNGIVIANDDDARERSRLHEANAPNHYVTVPHDLLVAFFRDHYGTAGAATNREDMDRAAEGHFKGRILV
jgi:hypothetical protein